MSFVTSLISISSLATWVFLPLNAIFLVLDGIAYSLLAYTYKVFMLIAQLNYNVLYAWMAPLIDRVKALILVLIMFKVGYALIQYMINPDQLDDSTKGGPALIKNIGICAGLLIIYSFVFSVMNELTLLFIGVPEGYEFTTLKEVADVTNTGSDSGFIARFIFGSEADNIGDFGKQLATTTLNVFLHSKDGKATPLDDIYTELANGDMNSFDMMKIVNIVNRIDKDVEYKWPILSTITALYLSWQIIKLGIDLAVRMFKLVVLQVLAPLAIVSIVDGGTKNNTWNAYTKTLISTWTDAFVRVATLFLATALIGKFWVEKRTLLPEATGITQNLIFLIVMFAAYKCVNLIPGLIGQIFPGFGGGKGESSAKGFGGLLGGLAGGVFGLAAGAATGVATGNGIGGVLSNAVTGAYGGATSGSKGGNVAGFFKNQASNARSAAANGLANAKAGGPGTRLKNNLLNSIGAASVMNANIDKEMKDAEKAYQAQVEAENRRFESEQRNIENRDTAYDKEIEDAQKAMSTTDSGYTFSDGTAMSFGSNKSSFITAAVNNDNEYLKAKSDADYLESRINSGSIESQYIQSSRDQLANLRADENRIRREKEQAAKATWERKEDELGITRARQEQKDLKVQTRDNQRSHADTMRTMEKDHKAEVKGMEDRKIPGSK